VVFGPERTRIFALTLTQHWNYASAISATEKIYGVRPDLTREGGSIPITLTFADAVRVGTSYC